MRVQRVGFLVLAVAITAPTTLRAQSASVDTPNDKTGNSQNVTAGTFPTSSMKTKIKVRNPNMQMVTGEIICNPTPPGTGQTGQEMAKRMVDALCSDAQGGGYTVSGWRNNNPGIAADRCGAVEINPNCCDPLFAGPTIRIDLLGRVGTDGFDITRFGSDIKFNVTAASGGNGVHVVTAQTNCGNTVGIDLLPDPVLVRLRTNGVDGTVTYRVFHAQGGQNPRSFSVNTTGLTADQIHDSIATGFSGLGLGLTAAREPGANAGIFSTVLDPTQGPFTRIDNAATQITEIRAEPVAGQDSEMQTTDGPVIPTLSEWGMIGVAALLLATGYYLLRRRNRATSAA